MFWYVLILTKKTDQSELVRGVPFRALSSDLAELPVAGEPETATWRVLASGCVLSSAHARGRSHGKSLRAVCVGPFL